MASFPYANLQRAIKARSEGVSLYGVCGADLVDVQEMRVMRFAFWIRA